MGTRFKNKEDFFRSLREDMVRYQLEARGIKDTAVLNAMRTVPRHIFLPEELALDAYADYPLPLFAGQTISQPYIVAYMTEKLTLSPDDRVLEIGTGSGYQTAILAELSGEVFSVERIPELSAWAKERLDYLGYKNVHLLVRGSPLGWEEFAPYDKIIVTAAAEQLPEELLHQLRSNGKMIVPIGTFSQYLHLVKRINGKSCTRRLIPVAFVPLIVD
ncbi:protein-L-isoaspartate(D-aspartate) O-methyltransferase [bacterium]|nr:protein-L-isoaspartate(D-aspartate) O-methyltransferase [bacterium]